MSIRKISFQEYLNHIFYQVEKLKKEKEYTDEVIANALSISKTYYSKIKNNHSDLTFDHLEQIGTLFDVSITELLNYDDFLEELSFEEYQSISLLLFKELGFSQGQIQLVFNYITKKS